MPRDIVDGESSSPQVQLVTEIACEGLMYAIIERRLGVGVVWLEGTEGCEGALPGFSGTLIVWMLLAPTSAPAPQQHCSIGHRGERQEHSGAQAKVNAKVLRDEEICTIVVRQNPFCEFLSKHTFHTFPRSINHLSDGQGTGSIDPQWHWRTPHHLEPLGVWIEVGYLNGAYFTDARAPWAQGIGKGLGIAVRLHCRWISLHLKILRQRALLLQGRRVDRLQQAFSPDEQGHAEGIANTQDFRIGVHFKLKTPYGATKTGWLAGAWDRTDVYSQGRAVADEFFRTEGTTMRIHLRWQSRLDQDRWDGLDAGTDRPELLLQLIGKIRQFPTGCGARRLAARQGEWQQRTPKHALTPVVIDVETSALLSQKRLCKRPQIGGFPVTEVLKPGNLEMRRLLTEKRVSVEDRAVGSEFADGQIERQGDGLPQYIGWLVRRDFNYQKILRWRALHTQGD